MKKILILLFVASLLSSCANKRYLVVTRSEQASDYRIIAVRDSSLLIVPWKYNYDLTPEVIREYGRVVPFDSLTLLRRAASSGTAELLLGISLGVCAGFLTAVALTPQGGFAALFIGAPIGIIVGALSANASSPPEMDMLPVLSHREYLRRSAYYSRVEQDTLQIRHYIK